MITRIHGKYTIKFNPELQWATVQEDVKSLIGIQPCVHQEDGEDAMEKCEAWAKKQLQQEGAKQ